MIRSRMSINENKDIVKLSKESNYLPIENIDNAWTLFLDRDGVINERIVGSYVSNKNDFLFLDGVLESIKIFSQIFGRIIIVTNQQGVGKKIVTKNQIHEVHQYMNDEIEDKGGFIDAIYYCPDLAIDNSSCRKPNIGMGLEAKSAFPEIRFNKSIMVGDSISDMEFADNLKMSKVLVLGKREEEDQQNEITVDLIVNSLKEFAQKLIQ